MMNQVSRQNSLAQSTILLVLGAETALFGTLVMSYLFLRAGGTNTPFTHFGSLDLLLASLNTLILLVSAVFAWSSARAIAAGHVGWLSANLLITLILGAAFIIGQVVEFNHSGVRIEGTIFGGAFFALISFHALHVLAGMTVLALNLARTRLGDFSARRHVAVTVGTWFWYYVCAVWIVLFMVLYLI